MNVKSIFNNIYFSIVSKKKLVKPKVIQFPVIDTCNSRCQMCRIWENKKSNDISVEDLRLGLGSELFDQVEGIGFNGGEPTLRSDLIELVEVVLEKLPNLKYVSLITNAYKYLQVIEQIEKMGHLVKSHGKHFDVMISLDGFGDIHDRVRGRRGNFENAKKVLAFLSDFDGVDNVRIGCTVIRENVLHLADLFEFCVSRGLYIKYRQGVPHQRLYTENLLDPYALTFEEKYEFVEFLEGLIKYYEPNPLQRFFYRSLIDQILYDKPRAAGCDWQHRGATITASGELAYCAVKSDTLMDNIADGDPMKAYFGNQDHLKHILTNECDTCNHDYVGLPSPAVYRRMMLDRIDERIGLKNKIRRIPFFPALNRYRHKRGYNKQLQYFRSQSELSQIKSESKQVLICGWYGTETLGDKAIIGGVMRALRGKLGEDTQFIVVALHTYISEMTRRQMREFRNTRIVTPEEGIGLAAHMDYVVFGGGPLMGIDSLAPMQAIFERAKQGNACTVVAGCGVGPLGDSWHNDSIATILRLSDIRIYRDARSRDYAKNIGVDAAHDPIAEDPAFTWLSSINQELARKKRDSKHQVLVLGLRDFPYQEYARHIPLDQALAIKENYERVVLEALNHLVGKRPNLIIKPLPMCTNHFGSDDRWFYRQLFRGHPNIQECIDYSLLGAELSPIDYCNALTDADSLLAMRFHSLVFGIGLGLRSIALDYTLGKGKVYSLAERFNVPLFNLEDLESNNLISELEKSLDSIKESAPLCIDDLQFTPILEKELDKFHC